MEDLSQKEINLLQYSIDITTEHIAEIMRTRNSWKQEEEIKNSKLISFKTEEDFKKYIEDLNNEDLKTIKNLEELKEKLYNFQKKENKKNEKNNF